jgi:hypothetical protein
MKPTKESKDSMPKVEKKPMDSLSPKDADKIKGGRVTSPNPITG